MEEMPAQRVAKSAFMALVTCWLLALVFAKAGSGLANPAEFVIYALTAGFGLEFLISNSRGRGA